MAYRKTSFTPNEWYHCYTRSIDSQKTFRSRADYERFQEALYLCNGTVAIERGAIYQPSHADFFTMDRGEPIVAVGAYCLMPNHFHLLLQEATDGGISRFMQRLGTSFSKYFNIKYDRVGNVFIKPFRSKHIRDDRYLKRAFQYIHLNPAELTEPKWKTGEIRNSQTLKHFVQTYEYSSLPDYSGVRRNEGFLLDKKMKEVFDDTPSLKEMLADATAYYASLEASLR